MVNVLTVIIVILDFVISIWNSYSAGLTYGMLKKNGGPAWAYISVYLGLALGIAGSVYVTAIVIGTVAYLLGLADASVVDLLLGYNLLVTGLLITVLGIGVTIQSIYIAVRRPGFWTIATALYNTFASIWNVFAYMQDFGPLQSLINQERQEERRSDIGTLILIAIIVILFGVFLSFIAFNAGRNHGQGRYLRGRGGYERERFQAFCPALTEPWSPRGVWPGSQA